MTSPSESRPAAESGVTATPPGLILIALILGWIALRALGIALGTEIDLDAPASVRALALIISLTSGTATVGLFRVRPWSFPVFLAAIAALVGAGVLGAAAEGQRGYVSTSDRVVVIVGVAAVLLPLTWYVHRALRRSQAEATRWIWSSYEVSRMEIILGSLLVVPSLLFLIWMSTSPHAGDLMIFGAMVAAASVLAIVAGAPLLLGGIWGALELPGRRWAHIVPLLAGIAGAIMLVKRLDS